MIPAIIHNSWHPVIGEFFLDERFKKISNLLVTSVKAGTVVCPNLPDIFRAFSLPASEVKVIIVGLSPYQKVEDNIRYATGLAFGVPSREYDTPSLKIIRDAIAHQYCEIAVEAFFDYTLEYWHSQGILLLNRILTVSANTDNAKEHLGIWTSFMKDVVYAISQYNPTIIWGLLGSEAKKLLEDIDSHNIVCATHPIYTHYQLIKNGYDENKVEHFKNENFFLEIDKYYENIYGNKVDWIGYKRIS